MLGGLPLTSTAARSSSRPISPAYTSVSFYTRRGVAYYAINDWRGRRQIELQLMTAAQRADCREEDVTAADRLIVNRRSAPG